jgi:hypothetical protein
MKNTIENKYLLISVDTYNDLILNYPMKWYNKKQFNFVNSGFTKIFGHEETEVADLLIPDYTSSLDLFLCNKIILKIYNHKKAMLTRIKLGF